MRLVSVLVSSIVMVVLLTASFVGTADAERTFADVAKFSTYSLAIDKSTLMQVDKDGSPLMGGVFKITYSEPRQTAENQMTTHVVVFVVAICEYDGIVVLQDQLFGAGNKLQVQNQEIRSFKDPKVAGQVVSEIYKNLCAGAKIKPSAKTFDRNVI